MHFEQHEYVPIEDLFSCEVFNNEFPYRSALNLAPALEELKKNGLDQSIFSPIVEDLFHKLMKFTSYDDEFYDLLDQLTGFLFATHTNPNILGVVGIPFMPSMFHATPYTMKKFSSEKCKIRFSDLELKKEKKYKIAYAASIILNHFYGQNLEVELSNVFTIKSGEDILEHYQISMNFDAVRVIAHEPIPELTQAEIDLLIANPEDTDAILKALPPENFSFEGVVLGKFADVTEVKVISDIKDDIVNSNTAELPTNEMLDKLRENMRSYMRMPEIEIGLFSTVDQNWKNNTFSMSLLGATSIQPDNLFQEGSIYNEIISNRKPKLVTDLENLDHHCIGSKSLKELGYRSLVLAPLTGVDNSIIGIIEMASKHPMRFDAIAKNKLEEIYSLFSIGMNKALVDSENQINLTIQQHFTSLHPSVQWRFREAASNFIQSLAHDDKQASIEPIVFKEVYPYYGQADIVHSSDIRNNAIKTDLSDTLQLLINTLEDCVKSVDFHLLNVYNNSAKKLKRELDIKFNSSDETTVVEFLHENIHPLLKQLLTQFPDKLETIVNSYFEHIDPNLHVIYNKRKSYEDSVHHLNQMLASFLEEDNQKLQKIIPHYFEYYKTDGIEYNLYIGQSIAPNALFSQQFLKNFRLWQLEHMIEITKKVEAIQPELEVPLYTAQLIFAYNNPLSIRFRMDEKQFDVDGAYNIRFELLKKRIDKSLIKGTNERLTQKGKISIVYLQQKEREEYLQYINYLISGELIKPEIEDLELSKVQGVDGLKALRVTVPV